MKTFNNPILSGFYPDPSICRVKDDYYMVNSTFMYYPGVPIFHSTDLVHWNQIGNVLDRPSQIPLVEGHHSCGIYAPTLRYHEGVFYMITTNVANGGNFIVTTTDPRGDWSEPYYLEAEGIDPSLFFDEDGRCYYCGTKDRREGGRFFGDNEIYVQELDYKKMKLIGDSYAVWHGALKDTSWPEGPHIYKKDGWYYLMISEAGTGHEHAVTVARSKEVIGYFEGYNCNPVLTHRHLGKQYPIVNVGHPDIVETQQGEWWMVCLASRPYGGYYRNLGRETFLVPMIWEDGWPLINPGIGKVELTSPMPKLPYNEPSPVPQRVDFDKDKLPLHLMYIRSPKEDNYSLKARKDHLRMALSEVQLYELKSPTFLGQRQVSMNYTFLAKIEFKPQENEKAGISLFQSNEYYYTLGLTKKAGKAYIEVVKCLGGKEVLLASQQVEMPNTPLVLKAHANGQAIIFSYRKESEEAYETIGESVDGTILSTDVAGGFVGTCMGVFGTCEEASSNYVDVDWMDYLDLD